MHDALPEFSCEPTEAALHEALRSGVVLCALVNRITPQAAKPIVRSETPLQAFQNVTRFLAAAAKLGVPQDALFEPGDLISGTNMRQVRTCIYALGRASHEVAGYTGPTLGKRMSYRAAVHRRPPSVRLPPATRTLVVFDFDGTLATGEVEEDDVDNLEDVVDRCFGGRDRLATLSELMGSLRVRGVALAIVSRNYHEVVMKAVRAAGWEETFEGRIFGGEALCTNSPFGEKSVTIRREFMAAGSSAGRTGDDVLFVDDADANCEEVSRALGTHVYHVRGSAGLDAADVAAIQRWAAERTGGTEPLTAHGKSSATGAAAHGMYTRPSENSSGALRRSLA